MRTRRRTNDKRCHRYLSARHHRIRTWMAGWSVAGWCMMADLPPVDWTAVRAEPAGPRHYTGPEVAAPALWHCPACGQENQSPLNAGCPGCGSGQPGRHVGVDPIITPEMRQVIEEAIGVRSMPAPSLGVPAVPPFIVQTDISPAFTAWWRQQADAVRSDPNLTDQLYRAFTAGWEARQGTEGVAAMPQSAPSTTVAPPMGQTGSEQARTVQTRTIIAALRFFSDQVLKEAQEEIASGEWLSRAEVDALIQDLKDKLT